MKFPEKKRTQFKTNILYEVIFQARFPEIIRIANEDPVTFQDTIRKKGFPETKIKRPGLPANLPQEIQHIFSSDKEILFISENGNWKVVLAKGFIALSCIEYKNYEEFEDKLNIALEIFYKVYEPQYFNRIGLRYLNMANKKLLKPAHEIKEFIPEHVAPELKTDLADEVTAFEKSIKFKDGFCTANVRHLMGNLSGEFGKYNLNNEPTYLIDIDCFTEEKIRTMEETLQTSKTFNENYIRPIFHWSITDELKKTMDPI